MATLQKTLDKLCKTVDKAVFKAVLRFSLGFILAGAQLGEWRPLGIACGMGGFKDAYACAGAFLGSILWLKQGGVLYAAAIMICFSCRLVLRDTAVGRHRLFMPVCVMLSVICVKAPAVMPYGIGRTVNLLLEGVFTALLTAAAEEYAAEREKPADAVRCESEKSGCIPISDALEKLGGMVDTLKGEVKRSDRGNALEWAFDTVCASCNNVKSCWSTDYTATRRAVGQIDRILQTEGAIGESSLPQPLAQKCLRPQLLCRQLNKQYSALRSRETARRSRHTDSLMMKKQYDSVAMLLRDAEDGKGARGEFLEQVYKKVDRVAKSYLCAGECRVSCERDRAVIELPLPRKWHAEDAVAVGDSLALALGCALRGGECVDTESGKVLRYYMDRRISAEVVSSSAPCRGEGVCGDCCKFIMTPDRRQIVILSDGMGTGEAAARLSQASADAVMGLVRAGVSLSAAAEAVENVLQTNVDVSGFTTLDMVEIDLISGHCMFVKYGAQPSYIVRGGKVQSVWKQSLPAGLGGEGVVLSCVLAPGDRIIMMTDGASLPGDIELDARRLCACMTSGRASDDMTAAVITVSEGRE